MISGINLNSGVLDSVNPRLVGERLRLREHALTCIGTPCIVKLQALNPKP